jgi:murein DD-endopeptidase MepM/ murein hydrolase activator NlpD
MIPVPGYSVGTPYGRRGPYWSCSRDSYGNGIHTGVDYPAPTGTGVVAARGGTVRYCNHGSAFGTKQLEIVPGDGTRDFYAHMSNRGVPDGAKVSAGQRIGQVGAEGNVTGPHLHFERHKVASGGWSCSIITDPAPSINAGGSGGGGSGGGSSKPPKDDEMEQSDSIGKWSPDDGAQGNITVGKTLNQARGYSEDAYQRVKKLESQMSDMQKTLNNIWNKVK